MRQAGAALRLRTGRTSISPEKTMISGPFAFSSAFRKAIAFLQGNLGKATVGLFGGVLCFCFPQVPGFAVATSPSTTRSTSFAPSRPGFVRTSVSL